MIIYRYMPKQNYTKFDNVVMTIDRSVLIDGAKVLYGYLAHFPNGKKITHSYIKKVLGMSQSSLEKYMC